MKLSNMCRSWILLFAVFPTLAATTTKSSNGSNELSFRLVEQVLGNSRQRALEHIPEERPCGSV
eukprot:CAMPEP_0172454488 /NCGR_PEP_ID=MMETSP1065-20121228/11467_1 /TAXON_ID=265537 /ORGANISM="Amphiprora paludosa, Strain CCMP125" /LENGTH=63 /DNA_ID=CAMNT_0013206827 /DNA_START=96 /DNA_END=283 /DNA_ORIENTATION=+